MQPDVVIIDSSNTDWEARVERYIPPRDVSDSESENVDEPSDGEYVPEPGNNGDTSEDSDNGM